MTTAPSRTEAGFEAGETRPGRPSASVVLAAAAVLALVAGLLSLAVGAIAIPPTHILATLYESLWGREAIAADLARDALVVLDIRLPRTALAMLVGATTAIAGGVMQGLFRNPLADPSLVGVSSGAALAAATWIVLGGSVAATVAGFLGNLGLPLAAFAGGLAASAILNVMATQNGRTSIVAMLLAGIALTGLAGAATGFLVFIASEQQLRDFTFWTLGSLAGATWIKVLLVLPFAAAIGLAAPLLARGLDGLALGEAAAFHVGVPVERLKRTAIVVVAGAVGASVAVSGVIGFFGLTVPHIVRLICGPGHRLLLPASALLGAALLTIADVVARSAAAPAEIPLGVITAAVGAPLMLWLLAGQRRKLAG
jgi:iron complex transport system permease protein